MSKKPDENKTNHKSHMWMMAVCCGLPIIGFLTIAVLGISMPSLETALLLLCPIGMIGMMYFMHRDNCSSSKRETEDSPDQTSMSSESEKIAGSSENGNRPAATKQPGIFEA